MAQARRKDSGALAAAKKKVHRDMVRLLGKSDVPVRTNLPQEQKISNALTTLLQLEIFHDAPLAEYQAALSLIAIAWNISILPSQAREEALQHIVQEMAGSDEVLGRAARQHIANLMDKKETLFPHDRRCVVSWDVRFLGGNLRVTAGALAAA
jgi:hypothetical protein